MKIANPIEIKDKPQKFSSYELIDGFVRPAPGAELKGFDPWEGFRKNDGRYRTVEQPYVSFVRLAQLLESLKRQGQRPSGTGLRLSSVPAREVGPRSDADRAILEWCDESGLLGILPVTLSYIQLPSTREQLPNGLQRETQKTHARMIGSWITRVRSSDSLAATDPQPADVAEMMTERYNFWRSVASIERGCDAFEQVAAFFPEVQRSAQRTFPFPKPNTREFWEQYGEKARDIARWASEFSNAVRIVSEGIRRTTKTDKEKVHFHQAIGWLETLARGVGVAFRLDLGARLYPKHDSSGLLASFAWMFLWDVCEDRRLLTCERCGLPFVSNEFRAKYCSPRCRASVQSQRHYEKGKSAKQ